MSVAPFEAVRVPPATDRFAVNEDKSNVPLETVKFAPTVAVPVRAAVPLTLICRVLKFDAPICGEAPVKFTVPVAVKVPADFVHVEAPVPVTVIVLPLSTNVPAD